MKRRFPLILLMFTAGALYAQDTPPKPPGDMGVDQFDAFKNNSFNIMNESIKTDKDITTLDNQVKSYSGSITNTSIDNLRADYKAVLDLSKVKKNLVDKIGQLDNQGKEVITAAKSFTPKLKSVTAVNNTNKAVQALDFSRKKLTNSGALLKADADLLTKELKARGEKVEDFVE